MIQVGDIVKIDGLSSRKKLFIEYLKEKIKEDDWHGVSDVANDLRELEVEMKIKNSDAPLLNNFPNIEEIVEVSRAQAMTAICNFLGCVPTRISIKQQYQNFLVDTIKVNNFFNDLGFK